MKSLRDEAKASRSAKAIAMGLQTSNLAPHPKVNPMTSTKAKGGKVIKRADGGRIEGDAPMARLDRKGGGKKPFTTVNITVAPQAPQAAPVMPPPMPAPAPKPPMMPPPGMGSPGGMPGAPMPGGMPMRARGGSVKHADAAQDKRLIARMIKAEEKREGRATGGSVYPKMRYGAGSGEGREEKVQKYGKNAKP